MTEKAFLEGMAAYRAAGPQKVNDETTNPYFRAPLTDPRREENIDDWSDGFEAAREKDEDLDNDR